MKISTMFFLSVVLSSSLASCSSEDDAKTKTGQIETTVTLSSNAALQGRLVFDEAVLRISRIDLMATSLGKNAISSTKELLDQEQVFVLIGRTSTVSVLLEAPAGEYNPLTMKVTTIPNTYELNVFEENGIPAFDLTDFKNNSRPALYVKGKFENGGAEIPVIIAIDEILPFTSIANQYGNPIVEVGLENIAEIALNPAVWFEDISTQMMVAAEKIKFENQEILLIHQKFNSDIYNKIVLKLETPEKSTSIGFIVTKKQE